LKARLRVSDPSEESKTVRAPDAALDVDAHPGKPKLVFPHGDRSCKTGGVWEPCAGAPPYSTEMDAITTISRSPGDTRLLRSELKRSMERATAGDLHYGRDREVTRVGRRGLILGRDGLVLEFRFRQRVQYPNGKRAVRLYFSEPDTLSDVLLLASVAAKPASKSGLELQDEHIEEAQLRIERHLGI